MKKFLLIPVALSAFGCEPEQEKNDNDQNNFQGKKEVSQTTQTVE